MNEWKVQQERRGYAYDSWSGISGVGSYKSCSMTMVWQDSARVIAPLSTPGEYSALELWLIDRVQTLLQLRQVDVAAIREISGQNEALRDRVSNLEAHRERDRLERGRSAGASRANVETMPLRQLDLGVGGGLLDPRTADIRVARSPLAVLKVDRPASAYRPAP